MACLKLQFDLISLEEDFADFKISKSSDDSGISSEGNLKSEDGFSLASPSFNKRSHFWCEQDSVSSEFCQNIDTATDDAVSEAKISAYLDECDVEKTTDVLPIVYGKHPDLKAISPETMHQLLKKELPEVENFTIVDCRYPYEYEGGHIEGAINIWNKDSLLQKFKCNRELKTRNVIIFHCEFSSERGPKLARFLRKMDREANQDRYPFLDYPDIYILEGGYKAFYENNSDFCEPESYQPMDAKCYHEEMKYFRTKAKSMSGEKSSKRRKYRYL